MNKILSGKRGLIMGAVNEMSIGWGIAKACAEQGASLAFSYQGEVVERRVKSLAEKVDSDFIIMCDVQDSNSLDALFEEIKNKWGELDFVVHAIAFSDKNELKGRYADTSLKNFLQTMHVSCFSFTEIAQKASKLMKDGGNMLTLTYYGAEKAVPNYNVMGVAKAALECSVKYLSVDLGPLKIRVNAISAGPIRTLAASGISDFRSVLKWNEENTPMRGNITIEDVGKSALYLLSDLSSGVTGEIIHVDNGYHAVGMRLLPIE